MITFAGNNTTKAIGRRDVPVLFPLARLQTNLHPVQLGALEELRGGEDVHQVALVQGFGRAMMQLVPRGIQGRKEGRKEGRKAGRQEGRKEHGEEVSDWKFEGGYSQSILKRTLHSKAFEESNYPDSRVLSVFLSGQNRRKCQGLHFSPRVALQPTV